MMPFYRSVYDGNRYVQREWDLTHVHDLLSGQCNQDLISQGVYYLESMCYDALYERTHPIQVTKKDLSYSNPH